MIGFTQIHQNGNEATQAVQTLADIATGQEQGDGQRIAQLGAVNVDLANADGTQTVTTLAEATIGPDGQIILTGEDGTQSSTCYIMFN